MVGDSGLGGVMEAIASIIRMKNARQGMATQTDITQQAQNPEPIQGTMGLPENPLIAPPGIHSPTEAWQFTPNLGQDPVAEFDKHMQQLLKQSPVLYHQNYEKNMQERAKLVEKVGLHQQINPLMKEASAEGIRTANIAQLPVSQQIEYLNNLIPSTLKERYGTHAREDQARKEWKSPEAVAQRKAAKEELIQAKIEEIKRTAPVERAEQLKTLAAETPLLVSRSAQMAAADAIARAKVEYGDDVLKMKLAAEEKDPNRLFRNINEWNTSIQHRYAINKDLTEQLEKQFIGIDTGKNKNVPAHEAQLYQDLAKEREYLNAMSIAGGLKIDALMQPGKKAPQLGMSPEAQAQLNAILTNPEYRDKSKLENLANQLYGNISQYYEKNKDMLTLSLPAAIKAYNALNKNISPKIDLKNFYKAGEQHKTALDLLMPFMQGVYSQKTKVDRKSIPALKNQFIEEYIRAMRAKGVEPTEDDKNFAGSLVDKAVEGRAE